MKKIIPVLACIIILSAQKCFSQQQQIDSLLNALKTAKEDTNKVILLNKLGWKLWDQNPDTCILLSTQALQLAKKEHWKKGIARSHYQLGWVNSIKGDYPLALENYNKALHIYEELKDKSRKAGTLSDVGIVYNKQGDFSKGLEYFFQALKIREELGDKKGIETNLYSIGICYKDQGDISKALIYSFKALKMAEELEDKNGIANILNNIGNCYNMQYDYSKAVDCFSRALEINEESGNKHNEAVNLSNIGYCYQLQGDSAISKGNKTFAMMDKYPKALNKYLKVLKIYEELEDKEGSALALTRLGLLYTRTGKFKEAEECLKKAITIEEDIGGLITLSEAEESISELYDTTGRYKLALEYFTKASVIRDTLFNQEKNKETTRKEMNYEFDKKEAASKAEQDKKDAVAHQQIQKQKILKYSFIGGLAALALFTLIVFNNVQVRNKLKLQTLRNKIASDLHDEVGSTLSSIALFSDVAKEQSKEVMPMLQSIGDNSRKMIESMADIVWTINPANDNFEKIILRMRSFAFELLGAKNIDFDFKVDETVSQMKISMESRKNLYLIFKEAINNLMKYSEADRASFSITGNKNNLTMLIRDNGKGFDVSKETPGNGLKNMKKRALEIGAQFLVESETGNGTTIQLILKVA